MTALVQAAALAAGTFVSEDLTCIAAGLSIRTRGIAPGVALAGCFLGIYLGDLALFGIGRLLGPRILRAPWAARLLERALPAARRDGFGEWFERHAAGLILAGRVLPGSRLPLYLAAGYSGRGTAKFLVWAAIAALLWVPLLVLLAAVAGDAIVAPAERLFGAASPVLATAAAAALLFPRAARWLRGGWRPAGRRMRRHEGRRAWRRARLAAAVSRLWRWEFWPAWLFYLPLVPWIATLSLRYRGFATVTAANPCIPDGGFVGESKHAILSRLPPRWTAASVRIGAGEPAARSAAARRALEEAGLALPVVGKPDVGQRGAGVRLLRTHEEVGAYLRDHPPAVILQAYHPGPHEAGVFYYRLPGATRGRIFSITDKRFPEVVGDGLSTIEDLVWSHPRHRMQAATFLARHDRQRHRVPEAGERIRLAHAGNHAQGTMFTDGSHLVTPELERVVDAIARSFEGFHFGRFDVRYSDVAAFKAGRDLTILELNGVTSESTDIYDPAGSLLSAYRTLFRQWRLLFRIGAANRARGVATTPHARLLAAAAEYWRRPVVLPIAD